MPDAISPTEDPSAYQAHLLGLAGPGDPGASLDAMSSELHALITRAGDDIRKRPAAGEWSVVEIVGHMLDAEVVVSTRVRWILSEDRPDLPGYDQDKWVEALAYRRADPVQLVSTWEALRRVNVELWRNTPAEHRYRVGVHRERGEESFELTLRLLAGHDRFHLDQGRHTLEQVRA